MNLPDEDKLVAEAQTARVAIGPSCTDDDIMDAIKAYLMIYDFAQTRPGLEVPDIETLARIAINIRTRKPS